MSGKRGPGGYPDPIHEAYMLRFGLSKKYLRSEQLSDEQCKQLSHCRSDEARRLLLGVSEKVTE